MGLHKFNPTVVKLVEQLMLAAKCYYNGKPIMLDVEFDALEEQLKREDPSNKYFQLVGSKSAKNKVFHAYPMLSQDKALSIEALSSFVNRYPGEVIVGTPKLDGMSVEVSASREHFKASTRGDGEFGEDCTDQMVRINSAIPDRFKAMQSIRVRGELVILNADFKMLNEVLARDGHEVFTNSRNGVVGLMNTPKNYIYLDFVTFFIFEVLEPCFEYYSDSLRWLESSLRNNPLTNVRVVPTPVFSDFDSIRRYCERITRLRDSLSFPSDGIVFRLNDSGRWNREGRTAKFWRGSIAYKFPAQGGTVIIKNIEWSVGSHDITPVAVFDPIVIGGAKIGRANLHSPANMMELKAAVGAVLLLTRQGDVIPMLRQLASGTVRVDGSDIKDHEILLEIPSKCPVCDSATELSENARHLCCTNPGCVGKLAKSIQLFCKALGIEFVGPSVAAKVATVVTAPIDILDLTHEAIAPLVGAGNAKRILISVAQLKAAETNIADFVASLAMGVSAHTADKLFRKYGASNVLGGKVSFSELRGVGLKQAAILTNVMSLSALLIPKAEAAGLRFKYPEVQDGQEKPAICFCVTGVLSKTRNEIVRQFEAAGWKYKTSLSSAVSVLLCNDISKSSSKLSKARRLGIEVLDEKTALARL